MGETLEFKVDTRTLAAAKQALEAVAGASKGAEAAAGRYVDKMGRLREANGRFVATAQQATDAVQRQSRALADSARQVDQLSAVWGKLGTAIKGLATVETVRRMVMVADEWQQITTRIALATRNSEMAAQAQERIYKIAQDTRTEYGAIASLFGRLTNATRSLGVSQDQVLSVTRAIAQSFTLSGASATEAASSAQQIGQALGSGVLQGDELRATLENNSRLAQAIADGLGVSVGQLKAMGAQGELTSSVVFEALLKQARALNAEFSQMGTTFGGAMTQFANALKAAIAENSVVQAFQRLGIVVAQAAAGALDGIRELPKLYVGVGAEQATAVSRAAGREAVFGQVGASIQFARPSAVQRELDAIRSAQRTVMANPLFGASGTVGAAGFGTAGMSGMGTLQSIGIGVPQGFTVGAAAAGDDALAAEFRRRGRGTGTSRTVTPLPPGILGGNRTTSLQAYEMLAEAQGEARATRARTFAESRRAITAGLPTAQIDRGLAGIGRDIQSSLNSPAVQRALRLQEEAAEARRQFSENLKRGIFEGLQQPIADFLRTWKLNTKAMGDLLRDALANALASVIANEATKLVYMLGRAIRDLYRAAQAGGASGGGGTVVRDPSTQGFAGTVNTVNNVVSTVSNLRDLFRTPTSVPPIQNVVPGAPAAAGAGGGGAAGTAGGGASGGGAAGGGFSWSGAASTAGKIASAAAPPAILAATFVLMSEVVRRYSGGNAAARRFNEANARRFREQQAALAAFRAGEDAYFASLPDGGRVDNAPRDFDVSRYRALALTGNQINVVVPQGTTTQQVDAILDELTRRAMGQSGNPAARGEVNVS